MRVGAEVWGARNLHVVPELDTRRQIAAVELLDGKGYRLALQAIGEVGGGGRGAKGEDQDDEQPNEEPRVALDPGPKPRLFVAFVQAGVVVRELLLVAGVHRIILTEGGERGRCAFTAGFAAVCKYCESDTGGARAGVVYRNTTRYAGAKKKACGR